MQEKLFTSLFDTNSRVSDVEESVSVGQTAPNGGETCIQQHELTPVEGIAQSDNVSEGVDSPSIERFRYSSIYGQTVEVVFHVGDGGGTAGVDEDQDISGPPAHRGSLRARLDTHIQRPRQYPRRVALRSCSEAN